MPFSSVKEVSSELQIMLVFVLLSFLVDPAKINLHSKLLKSAACKSRANSLMHCRSPFLHSTFDDTTIFGAFLLEVFIVIEPRRVSGSL